MGWWHRCGLVPIQGGAIDLHRGVVWRQPPIPLTDAPLRVLRRLAEDLGQTVPRRALLVALGYPPQTRTRALDMLLRRLRTLVETDPASPAHVVTVHRKGVRLQPADFGDDDAYTGRADALRGILDALQEAPLISIVGPGGIGKTRLLRQIHPLLAGWGPTARVDLTEARGQTDILHAVGQALGVLGGQAPLPVRIQQQLQRQPQLLVLDNTEACNWELAAFLPKWLATGTRVLCTTRETIGLRPERVVPLRALAPDVARQLLQRRARRLSVALSPEQTERIVVAAEGNPLALEISLRSPDTASLERGFSGVFSRSWRLLGEAERRVLSQATVFSGGIPASAVSVLEGASVDPIAVLDRLVRASMLYRNDQRYTFHPQIRAAASAHLTEGDRAAAQTRHAGWFAREGLRHASGLDGPQAVEHRQWLCTERRNLLTVAHTGSVTDALSVLIALDQTPDALGGVPAWLDLCSQQPHPEAAPALQARFLHAVAARRYATGDWSAGRACLDEALALPGLSASMRAKLLCAQIPALLWANTPEAALPIAQEAVALARDGRARQAWIHANIRLGRVFHELGRADEARETLYSARQQTAPGSLAHTRALHALSIVAISQRRWGAARQHTLERLENERVRQNEQGIARTQADLARQHFMLEAFAEARQCATDAVQRGRRLGLQLLLVDMLMVLAWIAQEGGASCAAQLSEGRRRMRPGMHLYVGMYALIEARAADEAGDATASRRLLETADRALALAQGALTVMPRGDQATHRMLDGDAEGAMSMFEGAFQAGGFEAAQARGVSCDFPRANASVAIRAAWCAHQAGQRPAPWLQAAATILRETPARACCAGWHRVAQAVGVRADPTVPLVDPGAGRLHRLLTRARVPLWQPR